MSFSGPRKTFSAPGMLFSAAKKSIPWARILFSGLIQVSFVPEIILLPCGIFI
jgi:hypothetical protein